MKTHHSHVVILTSIAALVATGCKGGAAARVIEPEPSTASEALGEAKCRIVGDHDQPLVVDWKAHERANLEEAMADGVAVVHYDCNGMTVLRNCRLDGSYRYLATSRKEEVIKLAKSDEVVANLPMLGKALGGELSATLSAGSTLDLAMVLVGKKRTTVAEANEAMLVGNNACAGATHFVRGAFVGAFALGTGTRASASSVAFVVKANSKSSTLSSYKEGDVAACNGNGDKPPAGCSGIVRVELVGLGAKAIAAASGMDSSKITCPAGLVPANGKCTTRSKTKDPYQCSGADPFECLEQCDRNDAGSCVQLAGQYLVGARVAKDPKAAVPLFEKACNAGHPKGCGGLGYVYSNGLGVTEDRAKGAALYQRACDGGNAEACSNLGVAYGDGNGVAQDESRAATFFRKACDGGEAFGCFNLGVLAHHGRGQPVNEALAAELYVRACDGKVAAACHNAGVMYNDGVGVKADRDRAVAYLKKGCAGGDKKSCEQLDELKVAH